MMTTVALLAFLLVVATVSGPVKGGTDYTYVNNQSHRALRGTTTYYFEGESQFVDRLINPLTYDYDEYNGATCYWFGKYDMIGLDIWLDGAADDSYHGFIYLDCDRSVLAWDNTYDHTLGTGVDVFLGSYGDLYKNVGNKFFTLYPDKPPCTDVICT